MAGVVIDPNIRRERVHINTNGDEIDPRTKQVVKQNQPEFKPTKEQIEAQINAVPVPEPIEVLSAMSIKEQIIQAEKHLADLKVLRKQEIEKMKAELAELEASE